MTAYVSNTVLVLTSARLEACSGFFECFAKLALLPSIQVVLRVVGQNTPPLCTTAPLPAVVCRGGNLQAPYSSAVGAS